MSQDGTNIHMQCIHYVCLYKIPHLQEEIDIILKNLIEVPKLSLEWFLSDYSFLTPTIAQSLHANLLCAFNKAFNEQE